MSTLNTPSQDWILSTVETLPAHDLFPQIFKGSSRKTFCKDVPELLNSVDLQELDPTLVDLPQEREAEDGVWNPHGLS